MRQRVVSFDFDDTLLWARAFHDEDGDFVEMKPIGPNPYVVPRLRQALSDPSVSVYIVTSRGPGSLGKTLKQLDALGFPDFPANRIRFTDGELKRDTLAELGAQLHYDDDPVELENLPTGCKGVLAPIHPSWLTKGIDNINERNIMRITESQLRRVIREEIGKSNRITEMRRTVEDPEDDVQVRSVAVGDIGEDPRGGDNFVIVKSKGMIGNLQWSVERKWSLVPGESVGTWATNPDHAELQEVVLGGPGGAKRRQNDPMKLKISDEMLAIEADAIVQQLGEQGAYVEIASGEEDEDEYDIMGDPDADV